LKKKLRNRFETKIDKQIKRSKLIYAYEGERWPYVLACHYIPDFDIITPNGHLYIETKGYLRPEDKRKLAAVKRQHPDKDIRIVFYSRNKSYIRWAERNGYRFSIGSIPKEWLIGL